MKYSNFNLCQVTFLDECIINFKTPCLLFLQQRTLLPRPQSQDDIRHMMTMSIVSNSSRASTGQFMPMKLGVVTPTGPDALKSPQSKESTTSDKTVVIATGQQNISSPVVNPASPSK